MKESKRKEHGENKNLGEGEERMCMTAEEKEMFKKKSGADIVSTAEVEEDFHFVGLDKQGNWSFQNNN